MSPLCRRCPLTRLAILGAVAMVLLATMLCTAPPAVAWQPTDGLNVSTEKTYRPDPTRELIEVSATYTLTNVRPDEVLGDAVRSYFYRTWVLAIPAAARDFTAVGAGRQLTTSVELATDEDDIAYGTVQLPFDLTYQQTLELEVRYIIPGGDPRVSPATARVNESFLSFSVWAVGDPGRTDVRVVIPEGFTVDLRGDLDAFQQVRRDGEQVLEARDLADPRRFFGQVYGRNDAGLITRQAMLPAGTATVRAWPDDPDWLDFVVDAIEDDIPVLEDLTGLEWPPGDIEVIETVTPYLVGYGGWFNASSGVIEIGDTLERDLILHELTHVWFNADLVDGRWITEGLAEEFASRVLEASGEPIPDPDQPALDADIRVPLADWASPLSLNQDEAFAYEQYHYNGSWWVIRQITDDLGIDNFSEVLVALHEDTLPYGIEGITERTDDPTQWTHFFDLVDARTDDLDLDGLFSTYVLTSADAERLAPRRAARARYDELVRAADTWSPPFVLRHELSDWDFDAAAELMDRTFGILEDRDSIEALEAELAVSTGHTVEFDVEFAETADALAAAEETQHNILAELESLQQARADLVADARSLGTAIEFPPSTLEAALVDLGTWAAALDDLVDRRELVEDRARSLGLRTPAWPDTAAQPDFTAATSLAEARLVALDAIEQATDRLDAPRGLTQRVGLWLNDPEDLLATARRSFETDELEESLAATARLESLLATSGRAGRNRVFWAAALTGSLMLAVAVGRWRPGRTARRIPTDAQPVK